MSGKKYLEARGFAFQIVFRSRCSRKRSCRSRCFLEISVVAVLANSAFSFATPTERLGGGNRHLRLELGSFCFSESNFRCRCFRNTPGVFVRYTNSVFVGITISSYMVTFVVFISDRMRPVQWQAQQTATGSRHVGLFEHDEETAMKLWQIRSARTLCSRAGTLQASIFAAPTAIKRARTRQGVRVPRPSPCQAYARQRHGKSCALSSPDL